MATTSTPLSDFPPEMLESIAETLWSMYPPVEIHSVGDIKDHFEMGRQAGQNDVAQAFKVAVSKALRKRRE